MSAQGVGGERAGNVTLHRDFCPGACPRLETARQLSPQTQWHFSNGKELNAIKLFVVDMISSGFIQVQVCFWLVPGQ